MIFIFAIKPAKWMGIALLFVGRINTWGSVVHNLRAERSRFGFATARDFWRNTRVRVATGGWDG